MTNLVIDIGNTLTKIAVFSDDNLLYNGHFEYVDTKLIDSLYDEHRFTTVIISSVKRAYKSEWENYLERRVKPIYFSSGMTGVIKNQYLTPHTLGLDRLAAVIGANYLFPGKSNLVIDGGTCITYDMVDADGNYFGGSISPGLNMRYKALNYYTAALPVLNPEEVFNETYGNGTVSAIHSGVQNGIRYELTGFIESYKKNGNELNIILCGGDSIFFDTLLKNSIFAPYVKIEPYLVLKGLNAAIQNNND